MRQIARVLLLVTGLASIGLLIFLLATPITADTWATLAADLAVIAAVISGWQSLRVLELQEDAGRPCPIPYFDASSRYQLLLLRVKNFGAGVAYDVRLEWDERPKNHKGEEMTAVDAVPVLVPQDSVATIFDVLGGKMFAERKTLRFEGTVRFKDATGKRMSQRFVVSADELRGRPTHDDEMLRALYDLQKIPAELTGIRNAIKEFYQQPR